MKKHLVIVVWLLSGVLINRAVSTGTLDQLSVRTATPGAAGRPRSEIDLETDKSVIICAGQNKSLECFSPGSSIAIEEAFWGRLSPEICPSEDGDPVTNCPSDPTTTPIVRNLCDDKEYCEIPARHNVLQPPGVKHCPGVNKYLAVKYKCVPEKHKFVLCNGETTELQCSQGWKIHIMSAYWGRDSPSTCPTPLGKFFTCANSAESLLAVRERCSGKGSCIVTADDKHLTKEGGHCQGIDKYAVISYRCQPPGEAADASSESGKKPVESSEQDALNPLHSALDFTTNSKTSSPQQQAVGQLNLSMLLPVPQYNRADKLKPIIEFLGEESRKENGTTLTGENLPVPKDSRPNASNKKESSNLPVQNKITPTSFGKINGIASSSKPLGLAKSQAAVITQSTQPNVAFTLGSVKPNNDKIQTVNHNSALNVPSSTTVALQKSLETSTSPTQKPGVPTAIQPFQSITEGLVKSFLSSKFGQALGKSLLDSTIEDSSYKNIMAQHFSSSTNPTSSPAKQIPENPDLVANIVSGLIQQHTGQGSTSNLALEKNNEKDTSKLVNQDSSGTNNLSSPIVSIGNKVFSLTDLANSLLDKKQAPSKSKSINEDVQSQKDSRRHPGKHGNKEKLKVLNDKIATLETLSDALDALTMQLSPDEKSEEDQKHKETSLSSDKPIIQEQRHRKHHTHHHHQSDSFSEDVDMMGALLARGTTHGHATQNKNPVVPKDDKDSNAFVGIKGKKALSSEELEILQNKINQAIEMAEVVGRQKDSAKQTTSSMLPLLVSGKVGEDVGAQTREEVATIPANPIASKGILPSKDHELQSVQDILTGLINNAMRKGTLNQLVQRWDRSGSPFAEIAKNISLYLQGNSKPKMAISKLGSNQALLTQTKTNTGISATAQSNLTSRLAKAFASLTAGNNNFNSSTTKKLFAKAVSNILSALAKRQGLHKSNATSRSSFVTTDTLTNFKGVLLGGRINKLKHIPNSLVGLESMLVAEILAGHGNETFLTNTSDPANFTLGNKVGGQSNNKIADLLKGNLTLQRPLLGGQGKEKLTYSSYETKNVSRTLRNNTLMEFMKSMEEHGGPEYPPMTNTSRNNPGDKHSQMKPHVGELMSMIAASLMELDAQGGSSKNKPQLTYEETGKEKLLQGFPNDHKISDFSRDDAVLQAPGDYAAKTNSSNKRLTEQKNSTQSPTNIIMLQNNTKGFLQSENLKSTEEESRKVDLGDQTVTLTLEAVDDTPTPEQKTNEGLKTQTGLRNNKVPHYLNLHSAVTLGKINATNAKSIEHLFPQGQIQEVPTAMPGFGNEAKKPEMALPSEGDGKLTTIFPSTEVNTGIAGDFQTKSKPELPLGLQMNAIGRIAETGNKASVTPADLSAALTSPSTSDLSSSLASKAGETKSFEDKILPMTSDLTSLPEGEGGETENIVSKASHATLENPGIIHKPSFIGGTPKSEARPTASEVREIATSIKALLKILNTYSKKLRLEDDEGEPRTKVLPTRSSTASRVNGENTHKEEMMKSSSSGITTTKYNDNVYANLSPSSITLPNYVDSGVFENIHEQPTAEANNYNWNFETARAHPQIPSDINPTKTSLEPRLDVDHWRTANEAGVTEDLKDLNLPSIEDDPTVRAVQNFVAEENSFLSQKRKAIQKHEQSDSSVKIQLPRRPGVFGRNTIPKHKGNHRNQTRVEHKNKFAYFGKLNNTRKSNVRGRDEIPRQNKRNDTRKSNARSKDEILRQSKRNETRKPNVRGRDEIPRQSKRNDTRKSNRNVTGRDEIPRQSKRNDARKSNRNVTGRDEIPRQSNDKHSTQNAPAADMRKPATQGNTSHHGNKSSSPQGMMGNSGNKTQSVSSRDKIHGDRKNQNAVNDSAPALRDTKKIYKTKGDLRKAHHPNSNSTGAANGLRTHDQRNTSGKTYDRQERPHGFYSTKVTGDKRNLHPMKLGKTYHMSKGNVTNNSGIVSKLKHVRVQKATPSNRL